MPLLTSATVTFAGSGPFGLSWLHMDGQKINMDINIPSGIKITLFN
jgi:hypothetical protein